ncbi:HPr family phosphocarrier protein [Labedaea rhizosphaerae]|uniref:Phosphocarrier protein HPr n=1 Tax=Labedaea rhizosphaerae TaxID=598644 RepID=A0A4V3CXN9_LABRH|nr:HPr family phosphocarrier protein [Labedaea rhizosphaerae]TDP91048.1 phosphocarrier protein HPr [Labedaea rhizosphaerae]
MAQQRVIVGSRSGLHARPAVLVAEAAARQPVPVSIGRPGGPVLNAASTLALMTLGAKAGDEVVLSAEGDEGEAAVAAVAALVEADLDDPGQPSRPDKPEQPSHA